MKMLEGKNALITGGSRGIGGKSPLPLHVMVQISHLLILFMMTMPYHWKGK
jgi:hypothetical protein